MMYKKCKCNWRVAASGFIVAILVMGWCGVTSEDLSARKISTTLKSPSKKNLKKKKSAFDRWEYVRADGADSLTWRRNIVFAGFDKQLASSTESFHISNHTDSLIRQLEVSITYLDDKGRMLHKRTETLNVIIPPGETRKVDIKSFDKQHSFYYVLSNRPSRPAIPFEVSIILKSLFLQPQQ